MLLILFDICAAPCDAASDASVSASLETSAPNTIVVVGRAEKLIGVAGNASEGSVGPAELTRRPFSCPAEVLETVPGVIVTQHSGSGRANLPTHAHGLTAKVRF